MSTPAKPTARERAIANGARVFNCPVCDRYDDPMAHVCKGGDGWDRHSGRAQESGEP